MALSYQEVVSDGTLQDVVISFPYFNAADVHVFINGKDIDSTAYTWSWFNSNTIRISPVVPASVVVRVYRITSRYTMHNVYSQNAQFDAASMDANFKQLLYIAQEYLEQGITGAGIPGTGAGEVVKGDRPVLVFKNAPSTPATPVGYPPVDWALYPSTPSTGEFTYISTGVLSGKDDTLLGSWSTPSRLSGEAGAAAGMSLKASFGAIGDGVTNDTAAIALARQYIEDTGNPVTVEPGVYLTEPFVMDILPYARQGFFIGSDSKRCVFKRLGTGSSPFIQLGSPVQTSFQANFPMRFIGIDGGAKTNGPAFTGYDLVRAKIYGVSFTGGTVACRLLGGISVSFYGATFEAANRGLEVLNYVTTVGQVSPSGGGWPNIIKVYGGEIVDNYEWGVFFNGGRMLCLDGVEVEGNGTTLGAGQGGIYVGPHIGLEVSKTIAFSKGVVIKNCWFEANKGVADIAMDSGINTIEDCLFFSSAGHNQNDILINGGKYRVIRCATAFTKTSNILETPSVQLGNLIDMCDDFTVSYNPNRTTVKSGNSIAINGGSAIAGVGLYRPIEMVGTVDGTGGVEGTVTFPVAFKEGTVPTVFLQVQNNSGLGTIDQPDLFNVSNTGFSYKKKAFNGTAITTVNYKFNWRALGEAI